MHTSDVTVLTTDLAHTDRRALSEAWYGALHVVRSQPRGRSCAVAPASTAAAARACRAKSAAPDSQGAAAARGVAHGRVPRPSERIDRPSGERRSAASPLARRIERAVAARAHRATPSAITIGNREGRVLVIVRSDGVRTRVLAMCAPALREQVERALAHARFALGATAARIEAA